MYPCYFAQTLTLQKHTHTHKYIQNKSMGWITNSAGENFDMEDSECMLFAAIMSATDGVAVVSLIDPNAFPHIFGTLIGEGCINDAVAIILYASVDNLRGTSGLSGTTISKMIPQVFQIAFFSILMGVVVGLSSALYFKHVRHNPAPKIELTLLFIFG